MGAIACQITSLTIFYSIVYLLADQRKYQSSRVPDRDCVLQMTSNAENVSIWWRHHENKWMISTSCLYLLERLNNVLQTCQEILAGNNYITFY